MDIIMISVSYHPSGNGNHITLADTPFGFVGRFVRLYRSAAVPAATAVDDNRSTGGKEYKNTKKQNKYFQKMIS